MKFYILSFAVALMTSPFAEAREVCKVGINDSFFGGYADAPVDSKTYPELSQIQQEFEKTIRQYPRINLVTTRQVRFFNNLDILVTEERTGGTWWDVDGFNYEYKGSSEYFRFEGAAANKELDPGAVQASQFKQLMKTLDKVCSQME